MSNKDKRLQGSPPGAVNIGYGNFVLGPRVVAILEAGSLPVKRLRERAQQQDMLLDGTKGRKTRSLIVLDSRHIVLSTLAPQTLYDRLSQPLVPAPQWIDYEGTNLVS